MAGKDLSGYLALSLKENANLSRTILWYKKYLVSRATS